MQYTFSKLQISAVEKKTTVLQQIVFHLHDNPKREAELLQILQWLHFLARRREKYFIYFTCLC